MKKFLTFLILLIAGLVQANAQMWLVGNAFKGWQESGNVEMTQNGTTYTWSGQLSGGTGFAFFKGNQGWSYQRGPSRGDQSTPTGDWESTKSGGSWTIPATGFYTIEYNTSNDQARIKTSIDPTSFKFAVTGDAFGAWSMPPTEAQTFTNNGDGTYTLVYEGAKAAEFKLSRIGKNDSFSSNYDAAFNPGCMGNANIVAGNNTLSTSFGSGSNMSFPVSGDVTLTISEVTASSCNLNITVNQVIIIDKAWYIAGDFTDWQNSKKALTKNADDSFSVTIEGVSSGQKFKFIDENGNWYGGDTKGEGDTYEVKPDFCTNIPLTQGDAGSNFGISGGEGDLTFTISADNKLTVTGWSAAEVEYTYTLAGNSADLFGTAWDKDDASNANKMEKQSDGTYKKEYTDVLLTAGTIEYKVIQDHNWNTAYGDDKASNSDHNAELVISKNGTYNVTFTFDPESHDVAATATLIAETDPVVALAGDFNDWSTSADLLTKQADGTYKITKTFSSAGKFSFKIDNVWYGGATDGDETNPGIEEITQEHSTDIQARNGVYNNFSIVAGEWTFVIDPATKKFNVTGTWPVVTDPTKVYIIGNGGWDPSSGTEMDTEDNKVFTKTITPIKSDANSDYAYIGFTTKLGSSAADWDGIAAYRFGPEADGENYLITSETINKDIAYVTTDYKSIQLPVGTNYTITVNTENNSFKVAGTIPTYTYKLVGGKKEVAAGEEDALFGKVWDTTIAANKLTEDADNAGTFLKNYTEVTLPTGTYEYKVINEVTNTYYPEGENKSFDINEAGKYNVAFTFNANDKTVNAVVTSAETKVYLEYAAGGNWSDPVSEIQLTKQADGTYKLADQAIAANSEFQFKVDNTWYGYATAETKDINYGNHENVSFATGYENNFTLAEAGTYTFNVNLSTSKFTVEGNFTEPITTYTLFGGVEGGNANEDHALFGKTWDVSLSANDLTDDDEDGVYTKTYTDVNLSAGAIAYRVAENHSDSQAYPANGVNTINVKVAGKYDVEFSFNADTKALSHKLNLKAGPELYLMSNTIGWDDSSLKAENKFTLTEGKYVLANVALPQGEEFKLRDNGTGDNAIWYGGLADSKFYVNADTHENLTVLPNGGENFYLDAASGNFTLTFDPVASTLTVDGTFAPWVHQYIVVGGFDGENEGNDDVVLGKAWDTAGTANELTDDDADGTYKLFVEKKDLTAGQTFKFKAYDISTGAWIPEGVDNEKTFNVTADGRYDITFSYTPSTGDLEASLVSNNLKVYYYGNDESNNWTATEMTKQADGTFQLTKAVAANAEFVIRFDEDKYYGSTTNAMETLAYGHATDIAMGLNTSNNFTIATAGTYTFTVDAGELKLSVDGFTHPDAGKVLKLRYTGDWSDGTAFTDNEDGTYSVTKTFAKDEEFKIVDATDSNNQAWYGYATDDDTYYWLKGDSRNDVQLTEGDSGKNILVKVAGEWTITLDWTTKKFSATRVIEKYGVVGDYALFGSNWADDVELTAGDTPNVYTATITNADLAAGDYEYKERADKDWGWYDLPNSGNQTLHIDAPGLYDIVFEMSTANHNISATAVPKSSITLNISDAEYATVYYENVAFSVPSDVTASTYKLTDGRLQVSKNVVKNPAGQALVLYKEGGNANVTLTVINPSEAEATDADNQLVGTIFNESDISDAGYTYFYLCRKDGTGNVGFYYFNADGSFVDNASHKAYLKVPTSSAPQGVMGFAFDDALTGISNLDARNGSLFGSEAVYTLNGVRVQNTQNLPKGIYVKNGKKFVVK